MPQPGCYFIDIDPAIFASKQRIDYEFGFDRLPGLESSSARSCDFVKGLEPRHQALNIIVDIGD